MVRKLGGATGTHQQKKAPVRPRAPPGVGVAKGAAAPKPTAAASLSCPWLWRPPCKVAWVSHSAAQGVGHCRGLQLTPGGAWDSGLGCCCGVAVVWRWWQCRLAKTCTTKSYKRLRKIGANRRKWQEIAANAKMQKNHKNVPKGAQKYQKVANRARKEDGAPAIIL